MRNTRTSPSTTFSYGRTTAYILLAMAMATTHMLIMRPWSMQDQSSSTLPAPPLEAHQDKLNAKLSSPEAVPSNLNAAAKVNQPYHYSPSPLEQYFLANAKALDLYNTSEVSTCPIVFNNTSPIDEDLLKYFKELEAYNQAVKDFLPINYDLRTDILPDGSNIEQVCSVAKVHPDGLGGIFSSQVSSSTHYGRIEPLLPVMRSEKICSDINRFLMSMEYLVHDFYSMCKQLKHRSRTIFIDMGASLQFHGDADSPAVYINKVYSKFGFQFDHIYAYEITQTEPAKVFERVPDELMNSFHWINVGVDPEPGAKLNPFTTLLNNFNKDDFVVVKLDIDTSSIENKLADQLRNGNSTKLLDIVDVFYYEHHVKQSELMRFWRGSASGSVGESLEMMKDIREKGVASHYWP